MTLDFHELADGMRRNNVGLGSIELEATASIENGQVVLQPTGQRFGLSGAPPAETAAARRRMKVVGFVPGEETRLEVER